MSVILCQGVNPIRCDVFLSALALSLQESAKVADRLITRSELNQAIEKISVTFLIPCASRLFPMN